jgi:hypothetical protein
MSITPYLVSRSANNPNTEPDLDALASFRLDEPTDYVPVQTDWQPKISAPDTSSVSRVGQGSESVVVYRYLYVSNGTQEEIMPYVSNLYDRDNWAIISTGSLEDFTLLELSNKATQEQILVLYQFNVGGFTTTSYLLAKLLQFPAVLRQQPYALFTAATIRCGADCRSAHEVLANIVHDR